MSIVFPIVASLVAWLLSGSAVPMALTIILLAVVGLASLAVRVPAIVIGTLVFSAVLLEFWLFRTGQALATSATMSPVFHLAIGLLWWEATETLTKQKCLPGPWIALLGSLLLVGSAAATDIYRFSPWLIHSVAALPLAALLVSLPNPRRKRYFLPIVAAIALLAVGVGDATERLAARVASGRPEPVEKETNLAGSTEAVTETSGGASRRLPRNADISFQNRIEIYLRTGSADLFRHWLSEPLYVRVSTVSLFENDETISPARSGRWRYDIDDGLEDNSVPLSQTQPSSIGHYTLLIERRSAEALPLLVGTTSVATDLLFEYADGWFQLTPPKGMDRLQYTVSMPVNKPAIAGGSSVFSFGAAEPGGVYLNLPDTPFAARVRQLTKGFDDARILKEIRDHLFLTTDYSLKFNTPDGVSPVENFLFGDGRGHCEIYAAAAVMMLRSVGIPSRLAYGYAGGAADRNKGIVAFRDSDSHAWAEILRPGGEWEIFDTVPQTELAPNRIPEPENVATLVPGTYYDFSKTAAAEASVTDRIGNSIDFLSRHFGWVTAAGLVFAGLAWWRSSRKGKTVSPSKAETRKTEPPFAPEFLRELELCGEKKAPGSTWREYAMKLDLPHSIQSAVDYYYSVRYAGADRDRELESTFTEWVREWQSIRP